MFVLTKLATSLAPRMRSNRFLAYTEGWIDRHLLHLSTLLLFDKYA